MATVLARFHRLRSLLRPAATHLSFVPPTFVAASSSSSFSSSSSSSSSSESASPSSLPPSQSSSSSPPPSSIDPEEIVSIPWLDTRREEKKARDAQRFGVNFTLRDEFEIVRVPLPRDVNFFKEEGRLWLSSALGRAEFSVKHCGPRLNYNHGVTPGGEKFSGWAVRTSTTEDEEGNRYVDFAPTHYANHPKVVGAKIDFRQTLAKRWERAVEDVQRGVLYELEVLGVGFRVALHTTEDKETGMSVQTLDFKLGQSHPLLVRLPPGIRCVLPSPTKISLFGLERQQVGTVAAQIMRLRKKNKYEQKGVYLRRRGNSST